MIRAQVPSTQSLLAFEALARHQNIRKAGAELCQTPGSISKQLHALEAELGTELFVRSKQGLVLTAAGREYIESVKPALASIVEAGARITRQQAQSQLLHIQIPPSFGERWLLPRYPELAKAGLDGKVLISTYPSTRPDQSFPYKFDAYVCFGEGDWPGCVVDYICGRELALVASPKYLNRMPRVRTPADLAGMVILEHADNPGFWRRAMKDFNLSPDQFAHMNSFDFYTMLIRSAVLGLGLALLPISLVPTELESGELVPVLDYRMTEQHGFYLVYLKGHAKEKLIRLFRDWMRSQA